MSDLSQVRAEMEEAVGLLRQDLATMKVGRATPALVEQVKVEAYETQMPLVELATINIAGPNELVIIPFDQTVLRNIEKALAMDRGLGLSPATEGNQIRLKIPPLTEERRKEFVKLLHQKLEAARIMIRQIRGNQLREVRQQGQDKAMAEDEEFRQKEALQKLTDEFNQKIEEIGNRKEEELMTV